MRYVVVGAGAIGGTVGAHMIRAGHDVLFVDAAKDHVQAINEKGLTIRGYGGEFTVKARAITPDQLPAEGTLEAVFLATKALATEAAVASFKEQVAPNGYVLSLQNGLNELVISRMIGAQRTVGCFVNFSADYIEPGVIHYGGPGAFYIGELDGAVTPRLEALQQVLSAWGKVAITDNIFGYLWGKQGYGAMLFATSLTNETMGDCIDQNRQLMVAIAREVLSVTQKLGVKALGFDGYDPDIYLSGDAAAINASLDRLVAIRAKDEKKHAGIWRDIVVRKRKTEVDHQPGIVAAEGEKLGLKLPLLKGIVRMIHEIEDGKRPLSTDNLVELAREGGLI
jgi:2-dehydropantoate 2-reductase